MKRTFIWFGATVSVLFAAGCGGGGSSSMEQEQTMTMGRIVTRVVGTAQPPVTAGAFGSVVTGVAGANFTSIIVQDVIPDPQYAPLNFRTVNDGLVRMLPGGGGRTSIVNSAGIDKDVAASPDGAKVAFASDRDGVFEIFVANADGTGQVRLTNEPGPAEFPAWSPDGSKVAFSCNRAGNFDIYVINADGTGVTRLTTATGPDVRPAWSPDGKKIAFESNRDGNAEIYTMDANGFNQTRFTNNAAVDTEPDWSPDGGRIAYTSNRTGNGEIFVQFLNAALPVTNMTNSPLDDRNASWAPDGSRIVFDSNRTGQSELFSSTTAGQGLIRHTSDGQSFEPEWGPNTPLRLVGTKGIFSTAAAGFLFGTSGDAITSVVVFDATTRSGARVSAQTGQNSTQPNIVFEVTAADSLTRLQYANDLSEDPVSVIGTGTGIANATNALVNFSASTGRVAFVLPFVANRSAGSPRPLLEVGQLVFRGRFPGVWDDRGVNRAPHGATEVRADAQSGKLIAVK